MTEPKLPKTPEFKHDSVKKAWEGDCLKREKIASYLTLLLIGPNEQGFVFNIDGAWGTGKTFFLSHWKTELELLYPCVFFNAWESDYSGHAFISFVSEITDQLQKLKGGAKALSKINSLKKTGAKLLTKGIPITIKALMRHYLKDEGLADFNALLDSKSEEEIIDEIAQLTTIKFKEHHEQKKTVKTFKEQLKATVDSLTTSKKSKQKPLFIFIDELDRCRPTYAIELLENIKHLFNVAGLVFIIATDTEQLCCSINAVYGEKFESRKYLRRFFDQTYQLPDPDYFGFAALLWEQHKIEPANPTQKFIPESKSITDIFSEFAKVFDLDLRAQQQCYSRLKAAIDCAQDLRNVHVVYLCLLIMTQYKHPDLFYNFLNNKMLPATFWKNLNDNYKTSGRNSVLYQATQLYFINCNSESQAMQEYNNLRDQLRKIKHNEINFSDPQEYDRVPLSFNFLAAVYPEHENFLRHKHYVDFVRDISIF